VGSEVTLDIIVDEIPADRPMIGYQMIVRYDGALLEAVSANNDLLLGAVGQYQPFPGLSDPLPDSDGDYNITIADLASQVPTEEDPDGANMETGKGVLSRVTFRAIAPGRATVGPAFEGQDIYPSIIDPANTTIGVDSIASVVIAVGEDCGSVPPEEQVTQLPAIEEVMGGTPPPAQGGDGSPTPTAGPSEGSPAATGDAGEDTPTPGAESSPTTTPTVLPEAGDDGTDTGMVALAIVLALVGVAMAGAGGFILYKRAQATGGPASA
jgi:hypothetical protein